MLSIVRKTFYRCKSSYKKEILGLQNFISELQAFFKKANFEKYIGNIYVNYLLYFYVLK